LINTLDHRGLVTDHDEAMKLLRDRVDETVNGVNSMTNQWEERDA
jgi:hypothetical protein